jgi:hypothetical protein
MNASERTGYLPGISRTTLNGGGPRNTCKRNGRDSNPRAFRASRFQGGCNCPLCHRSAAEASEGVSSPRRADMPTATLRAFAGEVPEWPNGAPC